MSKSEESTFVIILTAIILGLAVMYYCFAPKHNDAATQSRIDRLPPSVINRKTLNIPHRKMLEEPTVERYVASQIESDERMNLRVSAEEIDPGTIPAELASEKNQVMDALLDQPQIPSDYGETMMKLYRDRKQDVLTRDFAVQHIGLYAQALNRRGEYDAASAESQKLRLALFDVCRFMIG